jgi:ribosomal protein S18 acetylase RimI-like enzyme
MEITITKAKPEDSTGIHKLLVKNLIEVQDVKELTPDRRHTLETEGFLRKEVSEEYYADLIKNPDVDIFIAKNSEEIMGFATFHLKKFDVRIFRTTLENLDIQNTDILELLTMSNRTFVYLDQVSIDPKYQRQGVGRALIQHVIPLITAPMVSFIVKEPLANLASSRWHEKVGFKLVGLANGSYKNVSFEWEIYLFTPSHS